MTICPKCGKAYRVTPEICGECGTALTDTEFADPFAEAVTEEAALREQARLRREARLNPPAPAAPETEQTERAEDGFFEIDEQAAEASAKNQHTGLRTLAVTAALAVAAGGGWYGWKRLGGEKDHAACSDLVYFEGNQPYFYDGVTGQTYPLGEPILQIDPQGSPDANNSVREAFCARTMLSKDRSRIFYPQYEAGDDPAARTPFNYFSSVSSDYTKQIGFSFTPCCLNLTQKEPAEQKLWPLTNYYTENYGAAAEAVTGEPSVRSYAPLDSSGEYVLLTLKDGQYAVWKDPAVFGMSSAMDPFSAVLAVPAGADGKFLCVTEKKTPPAGEEPVYININDNTDISFRGDLDLVNVADSSRSRLASEVFSWQDTWEGSDVLPERYLYYVSMLTADHFDFPRGWYTLRRGNNTLWTTDGNSFSDSAFDEADQLGAEMKKSKQFLYGHAVHRFDLQTCEDTVMYTDEDIIALNWQGDAAGGGVRIRSNDPYNRGNQSFNPNFMNFDTIFYGPDPQSDAIISIGTNDSWNPAADCTPGFYSISEYSSEPDDITASMQHYLIAGGSRKLRMTGLPYWFNLERVEVSPDGRTVLAFDDTVPYCGLVRDDTDTVEMQPLYIGDDEVFFLGNDLLTVGTKNGCRTASLGGQVITELADDSILRLFTDSETGALYYTEYESADGFRRVLCRWENGTVTRIADRVAGDSFRLDPDTGMFSFARSEKNGDKVYEIYGGSREAQSLADCTRIGNGFAALPFMRLPAKPLLLYEDLYGNYQNAVKRGDPYYN